MAFRGIPYAAPPTGARRFRPPEAPAPWSGVRAARAFGPSAPQGLEFAPGAAAQGPQSEDCLYLNVYTPGLDGARRPVLVFIHGGAFIIGSASSPLYDGGPLARLGDVVVVTFNYRLGALGYLCLGDLGAGWGATANAGARDQIRALEWVRDNIEYFGGDPGRVTLFGESAGATSVLHLIASPAADGLFHAAIAQSAGSSVTLHEPPFAESITARFLAALEVSGAEAERLRDVPVERILRAQSAIPVSFGRWFGFFPVLDPATVPVQPASLFAAGGGAKVPLIAGSNRDEWNLFDPPKPGDDGGGPDAVAGLRQMLPDADDDVLRATVAVYRSSRRERGLPYGERALTRAILGDLRFRLPTLRFAEAHARRGLPCHSYLFTYPSPALRGALGACHALELPFVFGTLDAPMQDRFAGTGDAVRGLSSVLMTAWTAFARDHEPRIHTGWPLFEAATRQTLIVDTSLRLDDAPFEEERAAAEALGIA